MKTTDFKFSDHITHVDPMGFARKLDFYFNSKGQIQVWCDGKSVTGRTYPDRSSALRDCENHFNEQVKAFLNRFYS